MKIYKMFKYKSFKSPKRLELLLSPEESFILKQTPQKTELLLSPGNPLLQIQSQQKKKGPFFLTKRPPKTQAL